MTRYFILGQIIPGYAKLKEVRTGYARQVQFSSC